MEKRKTKQLENETRARTGPQPYMRILPMTKEMDSLSDLRSYISVLPDGVIVSLSMEEVRRCAEG